MNYLKSNKFSYSLIIIFFSSILAILISNYNLKNYDKIVTDEYGSFHQMIKYDALRYLSHGAEIKKDLNEGMNFFETGRENFTKYLPPRIAALIFQLFDIELYKNFDSKEINTGVYKPYLYIQSLIYFLSVFIFYALCKSNFSSKTLNYIILFLCLEPTILQYHGTFWSESFFFSFQIIIIGLMICKKKNNFIFALIGFFIAILSLQKQYAIFYIIPVIIYFSIFDFKRKVLSVFFLIFGFLLPQIFLGYNNFKRSGVFYVLANDNNIAIHLDLVPKVINKIKGYSGNEFVEYEGEIMRNWMIENSINFDENSETLKVNKHFMRYRDSIIIEKDKLMFDKKIRARTFEYFKEYPFEFASTMIKNGAHIVLLNPFHIYSDHKFRSGEIYYISKKHDELIPYRILYTLFIYSLCLYGFYLFLIEKNYKILILLLFSIIYFYALSFWHGNTRYFLPAYLYFAFFFGKSLEKLINNFR
tara:strand:- start:806 stop:2227 length:1422 start_codon:yes stop_codon:yes gene_type:complete